MTRYCLTSRNIKRPNNGAAYFGDEPGEASFLQSPANATSFLPEHRIMGRHKNRKWAEKILAQATLADGTGDIIFFVHGYNTDMKDAFDNHKKLADNLRESGLDKAGFVSYSWPAKGSFLNYLEDDTDARATALHLIRSGLALFAGLSEPDCRIRVHVMAHSMGALVVREAFRAAKGSKTTREGAWGVCQLILFGADISRASLNGSSGMELFRRSQRFTNYFNFHDVVLATSNVKRFMTAPRLGRHGAPQEVLDKVADVDLSDHWLEVAKNNDKNFIQDVPYSHAFYREDKVFAQDVAYTIKGDMDRRKIPKRHPHPDMDGKLLFGQDEGPDR
jgi:esterase/lipase superfamily enzyme